MGGNDPAGGNERLRLKFGVLVGVLCDRPGGILSVFPDEIETRPAVLGKDLLEPLGAGSIALGVRAARATGLDPLEHRDELVM